MHLRRARDFDRLFKRGFRTADDAFTVLALDNETGVARLGLAIARKHLRRATDRNSVKRLIRESFRLRAEDLRGLDIIVMARKGLPVRSRRELRERLEAQWSRVRRRLRAHGVNGR